MGISVRFVRFLNGEFDEEKRQKREYGRLEESDEYLEDHERHREKVGREVHSDGNDNFACKDVPKKTERERNDAYQFSDELYKTDGKTNGASEWVHDEFASVFPNADGHNACYLDNEE